MTASRRTIAIAAIVVIVLGAAVGAVATSHLTDTSGTITLETESGTTVLVDGYTEIDLATPYPDADTVVVDSADGSITFESSGDTNARVHATNIEGEWTTVESVEASNTWLHIDPADKDEVRTWGDLTSLEFRNAAIDSNESDFVYSSDSQASILLTNVTENTTAAAVGDDGTVLDIATSSADGTITYDVPAGQYSVELVTSSGPPELSDPSPTGDLETQPTELNVSVDDPDWDQLDQEIEVVFEHNGEQLHTEYVSEPGYVTADIEDLPGGANNWTASATDTFGATTVENYSFQTPDELEIRNEDNPQELVDSSTIEIRFFTSGTFGEVYERETTDGRINMTGLPTDESFIVYADASGYVNRRIFVDNLFDSQTVYLLPDTVEFVETVFELEDFSGDYRTENTVLEVNRNLDQTWSPVEGDHFGATGQFESTLAYNERHELRIINVETGETHELGSFTPTAAGVHTIQVDPDLSIGIQSPNVAVSFSPGIERITATSETNVTVDIRPQNNDMEWYRVEAVWVGGDGSEEVVFEHEGDDHAGEEVVATMDLANMDNGTLDVRVEAETQNVSHNTFEKTYQLDQHLPNEYSLLSWTSKVPGQFSPVAWKTLSTMAAVFGVVIATTFVSARTRSSTELLGVVALTSLGFFVVIEWAPSSLLFAAVAIWVGLVALRRIQ